MDGMSEPADPGEERTSTASAPVEPPIGEGEDDPLILWFLSLTPLQRLEAAQGFVDSVAILRNGRHA